MTDRDERIAAYLDGQLSDEEMAAFQAAMEADPSFADEVARFGSNDDLLRAAFDAPMQEPVDAALLERFGLAEPTTVAANDNAPLWQRWKYPLGGAIAASLALVFVSQIGVGGPDALSTALDKTPSRIAAQIDGGKTVTPQLSFAAADGRFCREFILKAADTTSTGIACRANGKWSVEAQAAGGADLPASGEIMTAGGGSAAGLEASYDRLSPSDPFDAGREAELIANGWTKNK